FHVDVDRDAEMHRIDAEPPGGGKQYGRHDQNDRRRFHEIAGQQQENVDQQQESKRAEILRQDPVGQRMRNILVGEHEREQHGVGDDVEQHRADVGGLQQHPRDIFELEVLVDVDRDDERV